MILEDLKKKSQQPSPILAIRRSFDSIKKKVLANRIDEIQIKAISAEKQKVIKQLNQCEEGDNFDEFEELAFYQERYVELENYLTQRSGSKSNFRKVTTDELFENFQKSYSITEDITTQQNQVKERAFKEVSSFFDEKQSSNNEEKKANINSFKANQESMKKLSNSGLGKPIFDFFEKKQQEIRRVGFKDLIDRRSSGSHSSNAFKKKPKKPAHDLEIRKLLEENKRLHSMIENKSKEDLELNEFQKNVLKEEKERCIKRIEELEEEVEELAKDNYKFKEMEKSRKMVSTFMNDSLRDKNQVYVPYCFPVRTNDLEKISKKNHSPHASDLKNKNTDERKFLDLIEDIPPIQKSEFNSFDAQLQKISRQPRQKDDVKVLQSLLDDPDVIENKKKAQKAENKKSRFSEKKNSQQDIFKRFQEEKPSHRKHEYNKESVRFMDSIDRGSRFDSFSMAQTAYNNSSLFLNASKNFAAIDSATSTRNKVAFFKRSLVIFRDEDYQIAFKRSEMNAALQKIRVIFYINNKTSRDQGVQFEYDYELEHFIIETTEKLYQVPRKTQSREVIEVSLSPSSKDLNSVIDMHISIGDKRYDLWIPVCFIEWSSKEMVDLSNKVNMVVQPDRQFKSYEVTSKILPLSQPIMAQNDEVETYLYGRSKFGNHEVKLNWWQKQLTIECSEILLDFLGFIFHHFK